MADPAMPDKPESLAALLAYTRELNRERLRTRRGHLVSVRLPYEARRLAWTETVEPERMPVFYPRPTPYWATFSDYERDMLALEEKLRAEGRQAHIRAWLPMSDG